ncbi:MAG: M42 family metallopeptidase [Anaerolineales bacterium]
MTDFVPFLEQMLGIAGLSAYEAPIRAAIETTWKPLVDDLQVSKLGSLHGLRRGEGDAPRRSILFAAHMDAIGLMVTGIASGGFLRVAEIGGLDPRVLPGQLVTVHGRKEFPGLLVAPPDRLLPADLHGKPTPLEYLLVDVGLPERTVKQQVRVGDLVSFAQPARKMGDVMFGHSLDNRASVAALTHALQLLQTRRHKWDVWAVATAQEEETLGGAFTSTFELQPSLVVAIDVTFAKGPGANGWRTSQMGKGPTLGIGPNIHPALYEKFKKVADACEIPVQTEVIPRHSGTDLYAMQVTQAGIPGMVIGLPLRYMHTPVEMINTRDIARAGRLIAEFVPALELDYTPEWEDKK